MHVIAKPILVEFWTEFPDAEKPLQAWYRTMESEVFQNFNELKLSVPVQIMLTA
nr:hypothetical protein [Crenothrix polyspora]